MKHMKTDGYKVCSAMKRASMYVRVGWIGAFLWLGDLGDVRIPNEGGRSILTVRYVPRQTGCKYYSVRAGYSPGYCIIITVPQYTTFRFDTRLYPKKNQDTTVTTLVTREITIPTN